MYDFKCIRFKSSSVQRSTVSHFSFSVLELLNPLNLEQALAQAPFYQGKTIRIIVGYQPGDNHDQWARTYARFMGKHIPGNPDFRGAKYAGRRLDDRRQSCLQHDQAGRLDARLLRRRADHGADDRTQGSPVRLAQIWLDRHALPRRPSCSSCAPMRRQNFRPICARPTIRRAVRPPASAAPATICRVCSKKRFGLKIQSHQRLSRRRRSGLWRWNETKCIAAPSPSNGFFGREPFITWFKKGFVRVWLQTEKQRHPKDARRADRFRIDGSIQSRRRQAPLGQYLLGIWGFGSWPIVATPGVPADRTQDVARRLCQDVHRSRVPRGTEKAQWERAVGGEELADARQEKSSINRRTLPRR